MSGSPFGVPRVAIACGGTGGHLFPGLAVGERLVRRGCAVTLLVSPKQVDQEAVKLASGMEVVTLPAVGLTAGQRLAFLRKSFASYRLCKRLFAESNVRAALGMGGFTSAPPILAARRLGASTFLHESNTIPGRATRLLSWFVTRVFVGFPSATGRLHTSAVTVTGTPVRPQFEPMRAEVARPLLGLEPQRPVVLVMGGSQGASGINALVMQTLPMLAQVAPQWQWFHLCGQREVEKVRQGYAALNLKAVVHPFFARMDLALGAASATISRSGASSMAELAAMRLPAILVPFPAATDNHQFFNAQAFEETGAGRLLQQKSATPEALARLLVELVEDAAARQRIQTALAKWHTPDAPDRIANEILRSIGFVPPRTV